MNKGVWGDASLPWCFGTATECTSIYFTHFGEGKEGRLLGFPVVEKGKASACLCPSLPYAQSQDGGWDMYS